MSSTESQKRAYKKYNSKTKTLAVGFIRERDKEILDAFEAYCNDNKLSSNNALKKIMIKTLVENGYLDEFYLL